LLSIAVVGVEKLGLGHFHGVVLPAGTRTENNGNDCDRSG